MIDRGTITEELAEAIAVDGYDSTARGAAELARELVRK